MKKSLSLLLFIGLVTTTYSQLPKDWMHYSPSSGFNGISTLEAYSLLEDTTLVKPVIVAVIDSGVDVHHEDLRETVWVNTDEIPDNGIDDDQNGYIDDIYGWNFIGGPDGTNVKAETLEKTRLYAYYRDKYMDVNPIKLSDKEKVEYAHYLAYKKEVDKIREEALNNYNQIAPIVGTIQQSMAAISDKIESTYYTKSTLQSIPDNDQLTAIGKSILLQVLTDQGEDSLEVQLVVDGLSDQVIEERDYYEAKAFYQYNPDFDSRKEIVKDNYLDGKEKIYGNNDVKGPDALHGTHVAGIIGAIRDNAIGMDGVSNAARIMSVRAIPDGDERDKDVANAIRYAVDNGASIINMSFGKGESWDKDLVDDAVKYAMDNDVLIIHAAGNDGKENDIKNNYPNAKFKKKGFFLCPKREAKNWIEVGALSMSSDSAAIASFSNYSSELVDIFAPGEMIYSTTPDNTYEYLNGTSMAAPVVAGAAAFLRSYFPTLTAEQVKEILEKSAIKYDYKVHRPGDGELVSMKDLSKTGGIINLKEAVVLAMKTKGKKKLENKQERV